ncbi:rab GTPase-activating protein 1-like, partial [Saccoglossus kowalevskii]|uniref:Rab GTPase-activating protein 1-like n=1 Tax=Saccoglossus kowalevskii TaxID=10224 RepID=A0ABM0MPQ8_SACKO
MEDTVSRSSSDSISTTDEYVLVSPSEATDNTPLKAVKEEGLKIAGNGNMDELKHTLEEVLSDQEKEDAEVDKKTVKSKSATETDAVEQSVLSHTKNIEHNLPCNEKRTNFGTSTFYTTTLNRSRVVSMGDEFSSTASKHDKGRERSASSPESPTNSALIDGECTVFSRIVYLGSATMNAPRSEQEATRIMGILKEQSHSPNAIEVVLSVPGTSEGIV